VTVDLRDELAASHELADAAAVRSVEAFGGRHEVAFKHDGTPVTEVDRSIEDELRAMLVARFPGDAVLGEERGSTGPSDARRRWTLDPLDGTKQFVDGIPLWSTLIALLVDDVPVLGLVDAPMTGERFAAVRGAGATRNGRLIRVSDVATLGDAAVGHSGIEEWPPGEDRARLLRLADASRRTRGLSDAWGQMQVASGALEVCVEHEPCGVWDWAATVAIVGEAGGRVTRLDGSAVGEGCDLLVTNGRVHDEVLSVLGG
jgi:histidinol-phosphatase